MKNYFINLFNYDLFANKLLLKAIMEANEPPEAVRLMAHLFAAQQVWYNRCSGLPTAGIVLWPSCTATALEQPMIENYQKWVDLVNSTDEKDFEKQIDYKTLKGDPFADKFSDILAHVINHGTHHRAQAGQQLKFAGSENLPGTDYILFLRQIKN